MKVHTTNYTNTFIQVAEDCPVSQAAVPPMKQGEKSEARLQFEKLIDAPYQFTSDEVLFEVHVLRKAVGGSERENCKADFFSKGQACFRASPLTKRYGWGVHFDEMGKMAIYAVDSEAYKELSAKRELQLVRAMRNKRSKSS